MSSPSSSGGGGAGGLRPLRTRRPYTPREPQRTLFTERARKKEPRPPSSFEYNIISLSDCMAHKFKDIYFFSRTWISF